MISQEFDIQIPNEGRHIKARLNYTPKHSSLQKLIILATGLNSHMDKKTQIDVAKSFHKAGFATLQFNFMAHGEGKNRSEGALSNVTLSSSIQDISAVWSYTKTNLSQQIDTESISVNASSYGGLITLMALEKEKIHPESIVTLAPFSLEKLKTLTITLKKNGNLRPEEISKITKLPISVNMFNDFFKNHRHAIEKKNLLGTTAIQFFIGEQDKISSLKDIQMWCQRFNREKPSNIPFINNQPADYTVYPEMAHFEIPPTTQQDIQRRSIWFIKKTLDLRYRY